MNARVSMSTDAALSSYCRSFVYRFLSRIFWKTTTADFLCGIDTEVINLLACYSPDIDFRTVFRDARKLVEKLDVEFARLFINPPPPVPLQESLIRGRGDGGGQELFGGEAQAMKRLLDYVGLYPSAGFFGLFDHVAIELELMGRLIGLNHHDREEENVKFQRYLYVEHLSVWIPEFSRCLERNTEFMSFYYCMGRLMKGFAAQEESLYRGKSARKRRADRLPVDPYLV